jgi:histidinol dehydrogenase
MPIPIFPSPEAARDTILRRVPFDAVPVPARVLDSTERAFGERLSPAQAVERILADVRARGDAALRHWGDLFDGAAPEGFAVPREELAAAAGRIDAGLLEALRVAAGEIERFHRRQPGQSWVEFGPEGALGQLVVPLRRVGLYAPGGAAPLPSSLLMAAIPARVAGVDEIIVCSPPQRATGLPADVVLAAAHVAGADAVYALGGAQAIAAMAYGTASVPPVDLVAGPGNLFVVLAQRAVFGTVGVSILPGPTETLVIADEHASPRYVAADLLAQAEHVLASAVLLTPSAELAEAVQAEIARQLEALPQASADAAAEAVEQRGGIVMVGSVAEALAVSNAYGPEHLCLLVEDPWRHVGVVRNAGGVFVGERSFEVMGDYVAGPSHIMPTEGTARYASPINVDTFRKLISVVGLNEAALTRLGPTAVRLAEAEGLWAHAAAVRARLE